MVDDGVSIIGRHCLAMLQVDILHGSLRVGGRQEHIELSFVFFKEF